jgi:hypothetical protein
VNGDERARTTTNAEKAQIITFYFYPDMIDDPRWRAADV